MKGFSEKHNFLEKYNCFAVTFFGRTNFEISRQLDMVLSVIKETIIQFFRRI